MRHLSFSYLFCNFLVILAVLYLTADATHIQSPLFQAANYFILVVLSLVLTDFTRLNNHHYIILNVLFIFLICHGLLTFTDIDVLLKYGLVFLILALSIFPRRNLHGYAKSFTVYPLILLVFLGLTQQAILFTTPLMVFVSEHARPVGLSVEPTFYSQQLLILWVLSLLFTDLRKQSFSILEILIIILIIFCATRTSMLLGFMILIYRIFPRNPHNARILIAVGLALCTYFYYFGVEELSELQLFLMKVNRLFDISGEPREVALLEMLNLLSNSHAWGAGYMSAPSTVGLAVGSLYGNFTIGLFYTLGVFIVLPLAAIFIRLFSSGWSMKLVAFGFILLLSQVMPFLFTSFGLFSWVATASAPPKQKRNLYEKI